VLLVDNRKLAKRVVNLDFRDYSMAELIDASALGRTIFDPETLSSHRNLNRPYRFPMIETNGRNMAMTIVPTISASRMIIIGSMTEVSASTAVSTSSS